MADNTTALAGLSVNLGLNTASFEQGTDKAARIAQKNAQDIAQSYDYSMKEAKGSLMLIEGEVGVHLPREMNMLISSIPGVGAAFASMLPVIGVLAAIAIVAKLISKHEELQAALQMSAMEANNLAINQEDETRSLELTNLKLDDQIAKLEHKPAHNYLKEAVLESANAVDKLAEHFSSTFQRMNTELTETTGLWSRLKSIASSDSFSLSGAIADSQKQTDSIKQVQKAMMDVEAARRKMADAPAGSAEWHQDTINLANAYKTLETAATAATPAMTEMAEQLKMASVASTAAAAYKDMGLEIEASAKKVVIAGLEESPIIDLRGRKSVELTRLKKEEAKVAEEAARAGITAQDDFTKAMGEAYQKEEQQNKAIMLSLDSLAEARNKAASAGQRTSVGDAGKQGIISKQAEANAIHAIDVQELNDYEKVQGQKLAFLKEAMDAAVAAEKATQGADKEKAQENAVKAQLQYNDALKQTALAQQQLTDKVEQSKTAAASLQSSWKTYFDQMKTSTTELGMEIRVTLQADINQMVKGFGDGVAKMIVEGKSLGQAMKQLGQQMLESMISMLVQWVAKWIISHTVMAAMDKIFQAQGLATAKAAQTLNVGMAAGQGAAWQFANVTESVPFPANLVAAPIAAAETFSSIMGIGALAAGGATEPGRSYLIGEKGPEVWTPGARGFVTPNSALGGSNDTHYHIDARGADAGVEARVMRAVRESENRSVARSIAGVNDRSSRRTA